MKTSFWLNEKGFGLGAG